MKITKIVSMTFCTGFLSILAFAEITSTKPEFKFISQSEFKDKIKIDSASVDYLNKKIIMESSNGQNSSVIVTFHCEKVKKNNLECKPLDVQKDYEPKSL